MELGLSLGHASKPLAASAHHIPNLNALVSPRHRHEEEDAWSFQRNRELSKLRLSKEQSAFLEETFKQHTTLNPKQKVGVAKQLNLRARQVKVWFQNRRARRKVKQTEVESEYMKRRWQALTEDNRRLRKELQDLRALKTSAPFSIPTTLTMCPSCTATKPHSVAQDTTLYHFSTIKKY